MDKGFLSDSGAWKGLVLLPVAFALLLAGCATNGAGERSEAESDSSSEIPDWYLNPSEAYPNDMYIVAVGSGSTRRAAEEQAYAGLSQVFEIDIQVDTTTQERYREIMTDTGESSVESEVELSQDMTVRSGQQLLNVQTAEAAVDSEGRVRTIAYIERRPTAAIYADLIRENDARISSFVREANASEDPVRRYAYLNTATVVIRNNEVLLEQLRIISAPVHASIGLSYNGGEVLSQRADAAGRIRVALDVSGDSGGRVAGALREAVAAQRFVITDEQALLRLSAEVEMVPIELNPNFESLRWTLELNFERENGPSIVSLGEDGRVSATTTEAARALAYSDIQHMLEEDFTERLSGYFDSLVLGN